MRGVGAHMHRCHFLLWPEAVAVCAGVPIRLDLAIGFGKGVVFCEHFFELNRSCGLNLDCLLARGHLTWMAEGGRRPAIVEKEGVGEGPHIGWQYFKRRREDDDESDTGAGGSRSSGPALPGN